MKSADWEDLQLQKEMQFTEWEQLTDIISRINPPVPEGFVPEAVKRYTARAGKISGAGSFSEGGGKMPKSIQEERKSNYVLNPQMSRRTFLKASAAAAVVAGMTTNPAGMAMNVLAEADEAALTAAKSEKIFSGICRGNCTGGCFLNVHVRDGKVVRTSARDMPNTAYNRICLKGLTHMHRIYHPDRLKYPMKRVGERGEGKWERISWDEAFTTITDKWKGYQKEYGNGAVGVCTGSGNYAISSEGEGLGNAKERFMNILGVTHVHSSVDAARGLGTDAVIGRGPMINGNEPVDLLNAKTIFVWGANPINSQQQSTHFILEAKDLGAKLVVVDPIYNAVASKSDIFVPVRPGSDAALGMAMINIVIRENWVDWDFVAQHTVAPFLVKESDGKFLRLSDLAPLAEGAADEPVVRNADGKVGKAEEIASPALEGSFTVNGHKVTTAYTLLLKAIEEYTPEKAAEICNIPVSQIEEITKLYATNKPSTIYQFFGMNHYVNGHYAYLAVATLAALTGNLGKPGAYCGFNESMPAYFMNLSVVRPEGAIGKYIKVPILRLSDVLETKKFGETPIDLKSLYISTVNVLGNAIERQAVLKDLDKIEFIVAADINMNETAQYADILLPAAHWFEADDASVIFSTHPHVMLQEKAIEPLYECKTDFEIYKTIAEKMGYGELFDLDIHEYIRQWLDTDTARELGLTLENLLEKKIIRYLPSKHYIYAEGGVFSTPTKRAQFYVETRNPDYNYGQEIDYSKEHLPHWEPPHEAWHENPLHEKYPFCLISDHPRWRTHSQWWDVAALEEIDPEPTLKINPADASKYDVKEGDTVRIFNDRGYVVMKVNLNNGTQPGVLTMPKGWEKHQFIDGHYQDLTSRVHHPLVHNSAFFDVLVNIEKI